jgi:hypothetical protein
MSAKENRMSDPVVMLPTAEQVMFQQVPITVCAYMAHGVRDIDATFGEGFAEAHPVLLAAYMQTAALDYGAELIARRIDGLRDSLRSDHQEEACERISAALENIAFKLGGEAQTDDR